MRTQKKSSMAKSVLGVLALSPVQLLSRASWTPIDIVKKPLDGKDDVSKMVGNGVDSIQGRSKEITDDIEGGNDDGASSYNENIEVNVYTITIFGLGLGIVGLVTGAIINSHMLVDDEFGF